ncbi:Crp/Fnr family transcriptional regulator [Inconstantimicrobium porci]|uniref:Crp/Fnr family transcriptional regulator n=1 Tax=Inconstantimicrobium porci TaxID=2652291 RepID=UPI002409F927|nr:cyclic nucleotide-binding domain-containing protein [Inconstantimicrobium porci]MDD6770759.1 cyclic nucleotide-binding domain-containing protein [Inconstantimicrobium porci]
MNRIPFKDEYRNILNMYGLEDIAADDCYCIRYKAGEKITEEGTPISKLAFVISGQAKVCRTAVNGRNLTLCYYISEGVIGDIELLLEKGTATSTVVAISDFECITIDYKKGREELKRNIILSNKIGVILAKKISVSSDNFLSSALYSGEQRLCIYILKNSCKNYFSDILTDVSSSVGMSYRHLFRLLDQLCRDNVLEKTQSGYKIINKSELIKRTLDRSSKLIHN